jgi:hypothetical protein
MSALPTQVQRQSEEADRIEAEIQAARGNPQAEPQPQQPEPEPVLVEQPEATAESQEHSADEAWQKRYQTLQGMFNAEVPRLNGRIKELESSLQSAIQRLDQAAAEAKQPERKEPPSRLVTEKDEEAFGSDLLDVVKRQAQEVLRSERDQFQQVIDELKAENSKLNQQLGNVSERQGANDRRTYLTTLAEAVPSFEQVNADPGFIAWLDEQDPMTGLARKAYLEDAYNAFDTRRTAAIFNSWPGMKSQPKPSPKADLARQVAPTATRSATTPAQPNSRIWATTEIEEFYRDVSKGRYRGRDAESARIESEIDLAVSEGRIKP